MKSKLESRQKENDAGAFLQTRISYSKRQNQRFIHSFETKEQAKLRTIKRKQEEQNEILKKKRHSPKPDDLEFQKDELLPEIASLKEGDKVTFRI